MKRPSANAKIGPEVRWTGKHYLPLTTEERTLRDNLRREIKAEGHLDAHAEYLRWLPARRFE
jgi:hypothetical protein